MHWHPKTMNENPRQHPQTLPPTRTRRQDFHHSHLNSTTSPSPLSTFFTHLQKKNFVLNGGVTRPPPKNNKIGVGALPTSTQYTKTTRTRQKQGQKDDKTPRNKQTQAKNQTFFINDRLKNGKARKKHMQKNFSKFLIILTTPKI